MEAFFGSQVKTLILMYLGLRGGCSGRQLAKILGKSPSQIFKALNYFEKNKIILKSNKPFFYALNPHYIYYNELISMIHKNYDLHKKNYSFLPPIAPSRNVDPLSIYEFIQLRASPTIKFHKFSDILREKYA